MGTVVAVDIGGTKTALARVESEGAASHRRLIPTPRGEASGAAFLEALSAEVETLLAPPSAPRAAAIGLGLCELVGRNGAVESGHRVRWAGLPVAARLGALAPVTLLGDVHAAALAEARLGAGRGLEDFLYLNIGTGVSAAWVEQGRVRRGARGHALAFASAAIGAPCAACGATCEVTVEALAGGEGLAAAVGAPSARAALAAAEAGEPAALRAIEAAAAALGGALATVLGLLDPKALVLGGGLGSAPGLYRAAILREIRARVWSGATARLPILPAALGPEAGLIGAALAAFDALDAVDAGP